MDYHGIFGWRVSSGLGKKISDIPKDQFHLQAIEILYFLYKGHLKSFLKFIYLFYFLFFFPKMDSAPL